MRTTDLELEQRVERPLYLSVLEAIVNSGEQGITVQGILEKIKAEDPSQVYSAVSYLRNKLGFLIENAEGEGPMRYQLKGLQGKRWIYELKVEEGKISIYTNDYPEHPFIVICYGSHRNATISLILNNCPLRNIRETYYTVQEQRERIKTAFIEYFKAYAGEEANSTIIKRRIEGRNTPLRGVVVMDVNMGELYRGLPNLLQRIEKATKSFLTHGCYSWLTKELYG